MTNPEFYSIIIRKLKPRLLGGDIVRLEAWRATPASVSTPVLRGTFSEGVCEMAEKKNLMTYEGLKKLEEELQELKVVRRKEVAQKIKEAREQGDLSENAEYDAAKDEQRDIEARIEEIEKILKNAEVADDDSANKGTVNLGCTVKVLDIEYDEEIDFKLVGSTEAKSLENKISNESPLGRALIGKKPGDLVIVETPSGEMNYKILKVTRN